MDSCAPVTANPRVSAHRIESFSPWRLAKPLIRGKFRRPYAILSMASRLPRSNEGKETAIAPVAPRREMHDENRDAQRTGPVGRYALTPTARGPRPAGDGRTRTDRRRRPEASPVPA